MLYFNKLLKEKTWHHSFDPNIECEDIPMFIIPKPPKNENNFEKLIKINDLKNQLFPVNNILDNNNIICII